MKTWLKTFQTKDYTLILFLLVCLTGFSASVDNIFGDPREGDVKALLFEERVVDEVYQLRNPILDRAMIDLTSLGSLSVLFVVSLVIIVWLATKKRYLRLAEFMIVALGGMIIPPLAKEYFSRARPSAVEHLVQVGDLSFPSGHAFGAMTVYFTCLIFCLELLTTKSLKVWLSFLLVGIILLVSFSRVYLGVHYPYDVFAGLTGAGAWVAMVHLGFSCYKKRKLQNNF